jgi:hypothetical protein
MEDALAAGGKTLDDARAIVQAACRCGSGAHPRRCVAHPLAYDHHVFMLNFEQEELERIERETAEAIANFVDARYGQGFNKPTRIAADIRAGAWRGEKT